MPERQRAYRGEEVVTVLEGRIGGKRGMTKIRNSLGFVEEVPAKTLQRIPATDPKAKLKFAADE